MWAKDAGAKSLERKLKSKYSVPCQRNGDVVWIPGLEVTIGFHLVTDSGMRRNDVPSFNTITSIGRDVNLTIHDVAFGLSPNEEERVDTAVDAYLSAVFPVAHALVCENHEHYGATAETLYATNAETGLPIEWDMYAGPIYGVNISEEEFDQRCFVDALSEIYDPMLVRPGVYWFRCYAGNIANSGTKADCFINDEEHAEASRRLHVLASSLQNPSPLKSVKQHFAIVVRDRALIEQSQREAVNATLEASDLRIDSETKRKIQLGLDAFAANIRSDEQTIERWMVGHGVPHKDAEHVVAMLPIALARHDLSKLGVKTQDHYVEFSWIDCRSRRIRFDDDDLFRAIEKVITVLRSNGARVELLDSIRNRAAAMSAVNQAISGGWKLDGLEIMVDILPVERQVDGDFDIETLEIMQNMNPKAKKILRQLKSKSPWWKFWARKSPIERQANHR